MSEWQFVVVTREGHTPVSRHLLLEEAADYIVRHRAYVPYTVLARGDSATAPPRRLTREESRRLGRRLFPMLHPD